MRCESLPKYLLTKVSPWEWRLLHLLLHRFRSPRDSTRKPDALRRYCEVNHCLVMKPSTILPVLTYTATLTLAATDAQNQASCRKRFPSIERAIGNFCNIPASDIDGSRLIDSLIVPSPYADQGLNFSQPTGDRLWIRITGDCSPPQLVPRQWCLAQFYELCASTEDARGEVEGIFGGGGCQRVLVNGEDIQQN